MLFWVATDVFRPEFVSWVATRSTAFRRGYPRNKFRTKDVRGYPKKHVNCNVGRHEVAIFLLRGWPRSNYVKNLYRG